MKQLQFEYVNMDGLKRDLSRIAKFCRANMISSCVFRIFAETAKDDRITIITDMIRATIPQAVYIGCTTNGNIYNGDLATGDIIVSCTAFEYASTEVEVLQYDMPKEKQTAVVKDLKEKLKSRPWVKAVEILVAINSVSFTDFCVEIETVDPEICVYGGGAFGNDDAHQEGAVFSSEGDYTTHGVVFLLIGGDDFHCKTMHITGWKPLGRVLKITKAEGSILSEINYEPTYNTFNRYLNIPNDENFFTNTLEFPLFFQHRGMDILRAPIACLEDGSLIMSSDVEENVNARLAYGDPWTILNSVRESGLEIQKFQPQYFVLFSCAARRSFWGDADLDKESLPFQSIAPTTGFFTTGEFLRTGDIMNLHNVTLVVCAMREGELENHYTESFEMTEDIFDGKMSMISRLATFIDVSTEELYDAYHQMEQLAILDGMTKLYNRMEIQRRMNEAMDQIKSKGANGRTPANISLIMMDIDDFKKVNDTYGHTEGDTVLISLAKDIKEIIQDLAPNASAGRWGVEEFMILLPECDEHRAKEIAEELRQQFTKNTYSTAPSQTISLGVTEAVLGEDCDIVRIRVDDALYDAKHAGKNQVVVR